MRVNGESFTTIDLFCGAGGITEGFRQAGYRCLYGNDHSEWAIETFAANHPDTATDERAIEEVDAVTLRKRLRLKKGQLDVLCGGPPCQGFSINAPERFLEDSRNSLFKHYVRFLAEFAPQTFLFENVPGMLSLGGGHIYEQILKEFAKVEYHVTVKILFAAHYGVPQERWRLIILGSRTAPAPAHPLPTHYATARANFRGGRTMTFQLLPEQQFVLQPHVTVGQALDDLPKLAMGAGGEEVEHVAPPGNDYANMLRNGNGGTYNHFAPVLAPINVERLKHIEPGGSWRDIPHDLLPAGMRRARRSDHTRRYGRLHREGLSATIMTKCDPHWGPVFLPDQDRALTVREAARLQSFPDAYRFLGPRVAQYEQVGNAVPPLMARAIADSLKSHLISHRAGTSARAC